MTLRRPTATRSRRKCGSPPMGRTSDCGGLEAEGDRRLHAHADDPQARRRDTGRQQHADRPDRRSARRSCGCWWSSRIRGGSIATCAMPCRATRGSSCRACCSIPGLSKAGRRQQGLHQAVPGRAGRALQVRRRVPGRRGRGGRPVDRRAMPAAEGAGRAPGERPGLHAGLAGARVLARWTPSWATSARSCSTRRSRAAGARARPTISS